MLDKGFTIFIVYHGSGSKYFLPDIVDDLHRSVRFIRADAARFGVDPRRLGAFGGSSGGHLTLMLATTGDDGDPKAGDELLRTSDRLAAVVAYYPPTDIRPWFKTKRWKDYPAFRFDPALAGKYSPLLRSPPHGGDALDPRRQGRRGAVGAQPKNPARVARGARSQRVDRDQGGGPRLRRRRRQACR